MNEPNNFAIAWKSYLVNRRINEDVINSLGEQDLLSFEENKICFKMKDLDWNVTWIQERFIEPIILYWKAIKSKTSTGSRVGYFYQQIDYNLPVIVVEGEIDWLSSLYLPNVIGLQSVSWLGKLVEVLKDKWIATIYLLVDKDDPADIAISKLLSMDDTFLSNVFDCRDLLWNFKDVNEFICWWKTIELDSIFMCTKSLWDFKKLTNKLLINGQTIKINHNEFAKYMISKFNLASTQKNLFVYDYENKKWIRQPLEKEYVEKLIMQQLEYLLSYVISNFKITDLKHTLDFMIANANTDEIKEWLFAQSINEINLFDGILDLETKQIRDYIKEDYKFQKLPYSREVFDNYSEPKQFLNFLNEILEWHEDTQEIISFLQEFIGRLFIANTKYEKALLVYWSGANWKGVLLSIIREILGIQSCSSIWLHEINKDQYLYNLIGKLANVDSDMQQNVQLDSWIIKKLVSWENISAKSVYKQPIEFKPYCRLLIATNELPYLKTIDNSIRRRFIFLHLKQSFYGKENPNLIDEILEEKNDIFVWSVMWLTRLLERWNFLIPKELEQELERFIKENDSVELFLDDWEVERNDEGKIYIKYLYSHYKNYCLDNWLKPLSKRTLSRRLSEKWFKKDKDCQWRYFLWLCEIDDKPF